MCEPVAILGMVGSGVGGLMKASGERQQAAIQARQLEDQATLSAYAGQDAIHRGQREESAIRGAGTEAIASQRVAAGASGVAVDSGSVLRLMEDSRAMSELDALTASNNAAREAWGHQVDARRASQQAGYVRQSGKAQAAGTMLTTAGSIVGAATRIKGG